MSWHFKTCKYQCIRPSVKIPLPTKLCYEKKICLSYEGVWIQFSQRSSASMFQLREPVRTMDSENCIECTKVASVLGKTCLTAVSRLIYLLSSQQFVNNDHTKVTSSNADRSSVPWLEVEHFVWCLLLISWKTLGHQYSCQNALFVLIEVTVNFFSNYGRSFEQIANRFIAF